MVVGVGLCAAAAFSLSLSLLLYVHGMNRATTKFCSFLSRLPAGSGTHSRFEARQDIRDALYDDYVRLRFDFPWSFFFRATACAERNVASSPHGSGDRDICYICMYDTIETRCNFNLVHRGSASCDNNSRGDAWLVVCPRG